LKPCMSLNQTSLHNSPNSASNPCNAGRLPRTSAFTLRSGSSGKRFRLLISPGKEGSWNNTPAGRGANAKDGTGKRMGRAAERSQAGPEAVRVPRPHTGCGPHKVLGILDRSATVTQNRWPDRDVAKGQEEAFRRFRKEVVGPCMTYWRRGTVITSSWS